MNRLLLALLLSLCLPLIGLAQDNSEAGSSSETKVLHPPLFTVGMLLPLTGPYASVGEDNRKGIALALAEAANPEFLKLLYADSRAEPLQSVNEFRRFVETERVDAVFAFRGPVGMAVNPLSAQSRIPLLGGVGNKEFAASNEFAFQFWPRSDHEGAFLASHISRLGAKQVALITAEDDWTAAVSDGIRAQIESEGSRNSQSNAARVVFDESVHPSDADFRTLLVKMRAKSPDAIIANVGLKQIGPLVRQVRDLKIIAPIYSNFWAAKPEVIEAAGQQAIEGLSFVEMNGKLKGLSELASGATVSSYAATAFLLQSIASISDPATSLLSAMKAQTEVITQSGRFPIQDRCVLFPLTVRTIRGGKVHPNSDPS